VCIELINNYFLEKRREKKDRVKAIIGSLIIDGTGSEPIKDGIIIVDGKKIIDVGPIDKIHIPPSAQKIDLGKRTLF